MKAKVFLSLIITVAMISSMAVFASADTDDNPGQTIDNPWAHLFTSSQQTTDPSDNPGDVITNPWADELHDDDVTVTDVPFPTHTPQTTAAPVTNKPVVATTVKTTTKNQKLGKVKIKKAFKKKKSAKKIKVRIKKVKGAKFYQVAVFKSKKQAKKAKKCIYVKKVKKVKFTLKSKKFKKRKKLYIRVRAYNDYTVGKWSKVKKVKIKKKKKK